MRFCNYSGQTLYVSWAWKDIDGHWITEGHYKYDKGECSNVYDYPLRSRYYYYYAQIGGVPTHSTSDSSYDRVFCIDKHNAYKIEDDNSSIPYIDRQGANEWSRTCSGLGSNYERVDFRRLDTVDTDSDNFRCTVFLKENGSSSKKCSWSTKDLEKVRERRRETSRSPFIDL